MTQNFAFFVVNTPFRIAVLVVVYSCSVGNTSYFGLSTDDNVQHIFVVGETANSCLDQLRVKKWIRQLRHPRFRIREAAYHKLKQGGVAAATALLPLWHDKDLDMADRVYRLLAHLLKKHNPPDHLVSWDQLRIMATDKAPSLNRWALRALGQRYKKGSNKAEVLIHECLLKCSNPEVVQRTVDIFFPLPSDQLTKSVLRDIAHCKSRIKY